jgi:hypothetical protein
LGLDPGTKVRDNLGRPLEIAEGKPLASTGGLTPRRSPLSVTLPLW